MTKLGFGGATLDFIKSMYSADVLFLQVNGELCPALYLTQGLKQGCNLSPILFNIMMIDLAKRYAGSGEGGKLGGYRVPAIIFADDIGLTATTEEGLHRLLEMTREEGAHFNMKISLRKSKILILSPKNTPVVFAKPFDLETVSFYKYLGRGYII